MRPSHETSDQTAYLVRAPDAVDELFTSAADARDFVNARHDATVTPVRIRNSLDGAATMTERRVIVDGATLLLDTVTESRMFRDHDSPIGDADVETFRCSHGHAHIIGFGFDRTMVLAQTQGEIDQALARAGVSTGVNTLTIGAAERDDRVTRIGLTGSPKHLDSSPSHC